MAHNRLSPDDLVKVAVCGAPIFDLETICGSGDIAHLLSPTLWGGAPADRMDWLPECSPSTHVYNAVTPTPIDCGEAYVRCPISQSEQMFAALKTGNVEFVRCLNSNHVFPLTGPPTCRVDYRTRLCDWLAGHLGMESAEESGVTEKWQA